MLENSTSQAAVAELQGRIESRQSEINYLKQEINRYKRELEIAQKSSIPSQSVAKQDAGTLALAIKSFKSELAEKEKEIVKLKKEIADLNRTNNSLKRERERYLSSNINQARLMTAPRVQPSPGIAVSGSVRGIRKDLNINNPLSKNYFP